MVSLSQLAADRQLTAAIEPQLAVSGFFVMGQFFAWIGLAITVTVCSLFGLIGLAALKITEENKCTMTYMYPNYIRIDMGATSGMIANASLSAEMVSALI